MTYTPKPGDTVKATLGDSVLYGTVDAQSSLPGDLYLFPIGSTVRVYLGSQWSFEPWTPPVTFKPLTVVRLAVDALRFLLVDPKESDIAPSRGTVVRLADKVWCDFGNLAEYYDDEIAKALAAGKAEVLFAGVAIEPSGDKGVDE